MELRFSCRTMLWSRTPYTSRGPVVMNEIGENNLESLGTAEIVVVSTLRFINSRQSVTSPSKVGLGIFNPVDFGNGKTRTVRIVPAMLQISKPPSEVTTTEVPSTTTTTFETTSIDETTVTDPFTSTTPRESTVTTTTTAKPTTTTAKPTTETVTETTQPTETTTKLTATTTEPSSTTTESPSTTTESSSTTTESPSTITEPSRTTTEPSTTTTTTKLTTTTEPTTSTTTTEQPTTKPMTTTTTKPTSTTTTKSTTTESPTSTTSKSSTTTTGKSTTMHSSTFTTESTTQKSTTTTTEQPTSTTLSTTTTTEGECSGLKFCEPVEVEKDCGMPPTRVLCKDPRAQQHIATLKSMAPLFTDATLEIECKNKFTQNVFTMTTKSKAYRPFSGTFSCEDHEVITGIEVCFQGELKYVGIECNELDLQYEIDTSSKSESSNSKKEPKIVTCEDDAALTALKLNKEGDDVKVIIWCTKIVKK